MLNRMPKLGKKEIEARRPYFSGEDSLAST